MCWDEWKKQFYDFLQLLFFKLLWKFIENWGDDVTKMTLIRKIKIAKVENLLYLSIQPIPILSSNFDHYLKKNVYFFLFWILLNFWQFLNTVVTNLCLFCIIHQCKNKFSDPGCFILVGGEAPQKNQKVKKKKYLLIYFLFNFFFNTWKKKKFNFFFFSKVFKFTWKIQNWLNRK